MIRAEAVEQLAVMCEAIGAEKLPGRLRVEPQPEDIRCALAYLRAHLDALEEAVDG